jgi:L-aspartate oxidase
VVVIATGGAGKVYNFTTNPDVATGDGIAMAWRAGARIANMEFVQFHPTCLYIAGAARVLISEIVRGAGGVLRDKSGARFMPDFHPDAELAPRDVVSRAVFRRMVESGDTNVYLDLSEVDGDPHELFPHISRICRLFGIDIARDPVPVRPGAHYMVGGIEVDLSGRTSIRGLLAAGECASSGVHGANRMGSNSLLEAMVLGTRAGQLAARDERQASMGSLPAGASRSAYEERDVQVNIEDVTYSLKSLMWREMGIEREASRLDDALSKIELWSRAVGQLAPPGPRTWQLENMLLVSRLATLGAAARRESRGVHYRTDHPTPDPAWRVHTELRPRLTGEVVESVEITRSKPVSDPKLAPAKGVVPST